MSNRRIDEEERKPFHHQQQQLGNDEIDALFGIPPKPTPTPCPVEAAFGFDSLQSSKAVSPNSAAARGGDGTESKVALSSNGIGAAPPTVVVTGSSHSHGESEAATTNSQRQLAAMDDLVKRSSTILEECQSGLIVTEEKRDASFEKSTTTGGNSPGHRHTDPQNLVQNTQPNVVGGGRRKKGHIGHMTRTITMKASSVFDTLAPPPLPLPLADACCSVSSSSSSAFEEKDPAVVAKIKKDKEKAEKALELKPLPEIMNMPLLLRCDFCIKFDSVCSQCHFKWKELLKIKQRALVYSITGMSDPEIVVMMFGTVARGTSDFLKVLLESRNNGIHWISHFRPLKGLEPDTVREQLGEAGRVFPLHVACAYGRDELANVLFAAKTPIRRSEFRMDPIAMIPRLRRESRIVEQQMRIIKKETDQRMVEAEDQARARKKITSYAEEREDMTPEERIADDEKRAAEHLLDLEWEKEQAEKAAQEEQDAEQAKENSTNSGGLSSSSSGNNQDSRFVLLAEADALEYIQTVTSIPIGGTKMTSTDDDEEEEEEEEPIPFDPAHEIRLTDEWEKMLAKHNQCRLFFTLEKAKALRKKQLFSEALDLYDDCLKLWPGSEGALCGLAKMFFDQNSYTKCIKQCDAVLITRTEVDWVEFTPETIIELRQNAIGKRHEVFHDQPGPSLKECGCVSTNNTVIRFRRVPAKIIRTNIAPYLDSHDCYRVYLGVRAPLIQRIVEDAAARSCDSSTGILLANEFGYEQMYESIRTDHPEAGRVFGRFEKFLGIQVVAMGDFHTFIVRAGCRVANPKYRAKKKSTSWFSKDKEEALSSHANESPSMVATKLFRIHRYGVSARAWEVQDSGEWEVADSSLDLGIQHN